MKKGIVLLVAVVAAFSLVSCATTKKLGKDVFDNPDVKIGVALVEFPQAGAHKAGSQGLLDVAINSALAAEMAAYLKSTDLSGFIPVKNKIAAKLEEKGAQAVLIEEMIKMDDLPKIVNQESKTKRTDYSYFKEKYDVDYIVLVDIVAVGTSRKYYGFIPLGSPKGYCLAHGIMKDTSNNKTKWEYTTNYKKSVVKVDGEWDAPPDYPDLTVAVQKAITKAVEELSANFK